MSRGEFPSCYGKGPGDLLRELLHTRQSPVDVYP